MRALVVVYSCAAIALSGCKRSEEASVRETVATVTPTTLLSEAATLAAANKDKPGFPVDPSSLPSSFRAFSPVEIWRYDDAFNIVTSRHFQHRVGAFVQPLRYPEPKAIGNDRYVKIAPGIYYYES